MQLTTGRLGKLEVVGKSDVDLNKETASKIYSNIPAKEKDFEELDVEEEDVDDEEI